MSEHKKGLAVLAESTLDEIFKNLSPLTNEERLQYLEKHLTASLAMYILLQGNKSVSSTMERLFKVEASAAKAIDDYVQAKTQKLANPKVNLRGALVRTFSFINIGGSRKSGQ